MKFFLFFHLHFVHCSFRLNKRRLKQFWKFKWTTTSPSSSSSSTSKSENVQICCTLIQYIQSVNGTLLWTWHKMCLFDRFIAIRSTLIYKITYTYILHIWPRQLFVHVLDQQKSIQFLRDKNLFHLLCWIGIASGQRSIVCLIDVHVFRFWRFKSISIGTNVAGLTHNQSTLSCVYYLYT